MSEIRSQIKRYQCEQTANVILNHLCNSNRINKASLKRSGYTKSKVNKMVTDLKTALRPWDHNPDNPDNPDTPEEEGE